MGSVTRIDSNLELERFFDFIYGDQTGYVYSPTKDPDPNNPVFQQYFFEWPTEKEALIRHVQNKTVNLEVYYSPALFTNNKDAEKSNFKGTNVVWVEFDGNDPANVKDIPEPCIKIKSSTDKHEHWYWCLNSFIQSIDTLEDITQRLAYHLDADLGCWNANRVLRPPGTRHHESGLLTSTFRWDPRPTPINSFNELPAVPIKLIQEQDINFIPQALEVIAKYSWAERAEDFQFFMTPKIERGHRSSALAKLGHICIELGMTNAETLSLLLNADSRWGKFSKRKDQKARLLGIINYCRNRHPVDAVEEEALVSDNKLKVYTFEEFMNTEIKLEWVIEGLIHKKGLMMISGPPDVGKSQMFIRFAERIAQGKSFLHWQPEKPMRLLFVSMEMTHEELQYIMEAMQIEINDLLRENFLIMPLGYSIRLTNLAAQGELTNIVEKFKPDGVIFDSFGVGIGDDINSEKIIFSALDYIHKVLRAHFGCFVGFIHHNRKPQVNNKKPTKIEDLFGSQYIGAALTTCIGLWPDNAADPTSPIEVNCIKLRMAKKFAPFKTVRTPQLDFNLYNNETQPETREGGPFEL